MLDAEDEVFVMRWSDLQRVIQDGVEVGKRAARTGKRTENETGFVPLARMSFAQWRRLSEILVREKLGSMKGRF